jgi:protein gp37
MGEVTAIAWTDHTWNPWMGCHKVSAGCKNCYAETLTKKRMKLEVWGLNGPRQRTGKAIWARPHTWNREARNERRPHMVFCASLADVFEDEPGPNAWRSDVFDVIRQTPWLDYQLLTKRPENLARMLPDDWGSGWPNVWLGTSIEDNRVAERSEILTSVPAIVHFISYEPAIGPFHDVSLEGIEWLIVGGESGPGYREMNLDWARDVQSRCATINELHAAGEHPHGTAFFFKQNHGHRTELGIDALGAIYRDYPPNWDRLAEPGRIKQMRPEVMV